MSAKRFGVLCDIGMGFSILFLMVGGFDRDDPQKWMLA